MEKLVEVSEQEVRIDFVLGCKCRANVRLTSLSATTPIVFKVQTSSPHKFLVNPPTGLIPPSSHTTFQIVLKPQSQFPATFPRSPSDRFLIKTALAPPNFSLNSPHSINSCLSSLPTHDLKLKIAFVGPVLLRHAISGADPVAVKNLIKRQRSLVSELPPSEVESLFLLASESCDADNMIKVLAEAGLKLKTGDGRVDPSNTKSEGEERWVSRGWTEVHVAAALDRPDELTRLIQLKPREEDWLERRDREGRTALHLAAGRGNLRCARLLVEAGADTNARTKDGRTALHRAASNGDRQITVMLIDKGADPSISTLRGFSPLDVARDKGHTEVVEILQQGESVLTAARRGELRHLEFLLRKGATTNYSDQYGLTALHVAAIKGHKYAVLLLIEFKTNLDCQDIEGHTPLHLAVEGGCLETVEALIEKGANINAKNNRGATPLYIATCMGYDAISNYLIRREASTFSLPSSSSSL